MRAAQKPVDEKGWLSRKTFEDLPARFKAIARELETSGEIEIENFIGGSENGNGTTLNSAGR